MAHSTTSPHPLPDQLQHSYQIQLVDLATILATISTNASTQVSPGTPWEHGANAPPHVVLTHDSGRVVTARAANIRLDFQRMPSTQRIANADNDLSNKDSWSPLLPGRAYVWRVRVWMAPSCKSEWASGRFTTALYEGFTALPIWFPNSTLAKPQPEMVLPPSTGTLMTANHQRIQRIQRIQCIQPQDPNRCNLTGSWRGNGGVHGIPISIKETPVQGK